MGLGGWRGWAALAMAAVLAGCGTLEAPRAPEAPRLTAAEARALIASRLPRTLKDREGWATDIHASLAALDIATTPETACAAIAVVAQESGFKVDPAVPNLAAIAAKEIERQRERAGVPKLVLQAALAIPSSDGRSYSDRLEAATTERELSELFEDFTGRVPLGKRFLADRNPVRTGGPMQVSIAFAQEHASRRPYPYPLAGSVRQEVFTRRGGLYFGIAHLLDYPASYASPIHRFADFNAGHYASRNAAFQKALSEVTGIPLALDGDLIARQAKDGAIGATEAAARSLAARIDMNPEQVRRDLERQDELGFERTRLHARVFALADRAAGRPLPRAVIPQIKLKSPKITRPLTTEWFATRVDTRYRACLKSGTEPG